MAYATQSDYLTWTGTTVPPDGVTRLLSVASTRVDELLVGVVYDVDTNGAPTDSDWVTLLKEITCEQAYYMVTLGDTTGAGGTTEMTVGRVAWKTGGQSVGAGEPSRYSPEVVTRLHTEGLLPVSPFRWPTR